MKTVKYPFSLREVTLERTGSTRRKVRLLDQVRGLSPLR